MAFYSSLSGQKYHAERGSKGFCQRGLEETGSFQEDLESRIHYSPAQ
jgi:hypothetical protein